MAMLYMDGFDMQDSSLRWTNIGSFINGTVTPWTYGGCLQCNTSSSTTKSFTAAAYVFVGVAVAFNQAATVGFLGVNGDAGVTRHLTVAITNTDQIALYRGTTGGTLLASTAAGAVSHGGGTSPTWYYIELEATISDTVGVANVKVNGTTVITFSGDTKNAGTNSTIDTVALANISGGTINYYDDLYVCDNTGSTNNTFLGPWFRVQTIKPSAAGASTQFTPVSGSNFSNVNDAPDNTATYNSDTVSGHRDTFAMDDLLAGSGTIFAAQQTMHARQLDGGTATIKQAQKSGATISYGSTKTLGASNAAFTDLFETNPATGLAYTVAEMNALEAGYEIV